VRNIASSVCFVVLCLISACSSSHQSLGTQTSTVPARVDTLSCVSGVSASAAKRPPGIAGTLRMVGGPAPGINRSVAGTVTITSLSGSHCDLRVVAGGSFEATVPVGRYRITGHSPAFGYGKYECSGGTVRVTSAGETVSTVVCPVR
jgi:hypothetical protein